MSILAIDQLYKRYGRIEAVNKLSLQIERGMVYGLLGPNGSGKTTTLGIIMGILSPNSGTYEWFDGKYGNNPRRHIGTLLETPNFYPYLDAIDNLQLIAHIRKVKHPNLGEVLDLVNLSHRKHSRFKTYSLGMKQRLAIAAAMLGDPEVLIFDEPTNGLDPQGIAEVRETIQQIAQSGKTILMASHILDEVERICSHVAIMKNGKLLATGSVGAILSQDPMIEMACDDNKALATLLQSQHMVTKIEEKPNTLLVHFKEAIPPSLINELAFKNQLTLHYLAAKKRSLEAEFLEITQNPKTPKLLNS
ncbi:MAG: ATP-binding cassette domain-containing protein [Bacteroidota bacterium]